MDHSRKTDYYHIGWYTLSVASLVALPIIFVTMGGPSTSFTQGSPGVLTDLNDAYSQRVGPALVEPGELGQETIPESQQQQQYSSYANPQDKFSIQYPSDWSVEQGGRAGVIATFSSPLESRFDTFAENFIIGVENLTAGASLDNYSRSVVALLESQPPGPEFNLTGSPISTTFGGLPAQKVGFRLTAPNEQGHGSEAALQGVQIWAIDNDTAYVLSFTAEQSTFSRYLPVIDHIVDSFRITGAA